MLQQWLSNSSIKIKRSIIWLPVTTSMKIILIQISPGLQKNFLSILLLLPLRKQPVRSFQKYFCYSCQKCTAQMSSWENTRSFQRHSTKYLASIQQSGHIHERRIPSPFKAWWACLAVCQCFWIPSTVHLAAWHIWPQKSKHNLSSTLDNLTYTIHSLRQQRNPGQKPCPTPLQV